MAMSPFPTSAEPLPRFNQMDHRQMMIRELLIWLVGVPVPITAIIGLFVL